MTAKSDDTPDEAATESSREPLTVDADGFKVSLERVFSGPMDLLLHLVREQEVEIVDVEIHRIVHDYLGYLKEMADLDIEAAADFVVMAATLMAIKSRSLLPKEELDLEEELDPKDELIQRLLEYRRFRGASEFLELQWQRRALLRERGWRGEVKTSRPEPMLDMGDLTAFDLLASWSRLQREVLANRPHRIAGDARPLKHYVERLVNRLKSMGKLSLLESARGEEGELRTNLIGSFCAVLELAKLGLVTIDQDEINDDIRLELSIEEGTDIDQLLAGETFDEPSAETLEDAEALAASLGENGESPTAEA